MSWALIRDHGEGASCGHSHPGVVVVQQRHDSIDGRSDIVCRNDLGRHLAHPPLFMRRRGDNRSGGAVVPYVEEPARGPHSRPVALDAPGATFEDDLGRRPTKHADEIWIDTLRVEKQNAVVNDGRPTPALALGLNRRFGRDSPDARHYESRSRTIRRRRHAELHGKEIQEIVEGDPGWRPVDVGVVLGEY